MYLPWDASYSVEVKIFDEQHKQLFEFINRLHDGMEAGHSHEVLVEILDGLVEYTMTHFADEERLMEESNYPDYTKHKEEHENLISKVIAYQEDVTAGNAKLDKAVLDFLIDWLKNHIAKTDKNYGPHLIATGINDEENVQYLEWDNSYSVGVRRMDDQHKKWFKLINDFFDVLRADKGKEALKPVFDGMLDYTRVHFASEEEAMLDNDYPFYEEHKKEHDMLVEKVMHYHQDFYAGKIDLTIDVMDFMVTWAKHHIANVDKKYGPFLEGSEL